jgi:hypothetical protein
VVVDSITGTVYDGPFSVDELPLKWLEQHEDKPSKRMEFYPNSRLMKINACPNEQECGYYDYEMIDRKGLQLIRKELLPKQYQPE